MSVRLYMDVHVPRAITDGLRLRSVDIMTAHDDGARQLTDSELLDRATALDRVLFTMDADLLMEATRRQRAGQAFTGLIYAYQLNVTIGQCVRDLELISFVAEPADLRSRVEYLPLR